MQNVQIRLQSPTEVQRFVAALAPLDGDFDLLSEGYVLDARSLMGIFTLDLSQPITLRVADDTPENMEAVAPFIVNAPAQEGA